MASVRCLVSPPNSCSTHPRARVDFICRRPNLQAQRRNWPRTPLVGASLAIARLWLAKARKRRSFWRFVAGIVQNNQVRDRIKRFVCVVDWFVGGAVADIPPGVTRDGARTLCSLFTFPPFLCGAYCCVLTLRREGVGASSTS